MRVELHVALADVEARADHLEHMWLLMSEHEGYRQLCDARGTPFASVGAFCAAPYPFGLGVPLRVVESIIHERKSAQAHAQSALQQPLPAHGEIGGGHTRSRGANSTSAPSTGTASSTSRGSTHASYLARRIARDRPDILARMQAGEFKSVRAAAIEAGLVRRQFTIPHDPAGAARSLLRHFDEAELARLLDLLRRPDQGGTR